MVGIRVYFFISRSLVINYYNNFHIQSDIFISLLLYILRVFITIIISEIQRIPFFIENHSYLWVRYYFCLRNYSENLIFPQYNCFTQKLHIF